MAKFKGRKLKHGDRARYLVRMTEQHHGIKGKETGNAD